MTDSDLLEPGDLSDGERARLHEDLVGDPASAAYGDAWARWRQRTAELAGSADAADIARGARIDAYIDATFAPPRSRRDDLAAASTGAAAAGDDVLGELGPEAAGGGGAAGTGGHGAAVHGGGQLAHGGGQLAQGGGQLAQSGGQLARGGGQLAEGGEATGHRAGQLASGASGSQAPSAGATAARTGLLANTPVLTGIVVAAVAAVAVVVTLVATGGSTKTAAPPRRGTGAPTVTVPTTPAYRCTGTAFKLFDNWTTAGVRNGGKIPSFSTNGKAYCLVAMATYHWNTGLGAAPGTLALQRTAGPSGMGVSLPPTQAVGTTGSNTVKDASWSYNRPNALSDPLILDGTYQCVDSQPSTWSQTSGLGFCWVEVTDATPR